MARPAINRNATKEIQFHENAQPKAETKNRQPKPFRLSRRPYLSPGSPANKAPTIVPQRAIATVSPSVEGESLNNSVNALVTPAITAVSNPKRRPPRPATAVLFKSGRFTLWVRC